MEHSVHLVQLRQRKPSLMGVDGVSIVSALVDHHVLLEITFGKAMPYIWWSLSLLHVEFFRMENCNILPYSLIVVINS